MKYKEVMQCRGFRLNQKQWKKLGILAKKNDCNESDVLRQMIDEYDEYDESGKKQK